MISPTNKLHIFICHYTKLKQRKEHILKELKSFEKDIVIEFIKGYDKEEITEEVCAKFFLESREEWVKRCSFYLKFDNFRSLLIEERSIALKHYLALKRIQELGLPYALVIEDDCIFRYDFFERLRIVFEQLPDDWDVYYPNAYQGIYHLQNQILERGMQKAYMLSARITRYFIDRFKKEKNFGGALRLLQSGHPAGFGAYSIFFNQKCCSKIIEALERDKIVHPIDWEYNWIFFCLNLNVYLASNKKNVLTSTGYWKSHVQLR